MNILYKQLRLSGLGITWNELPPTPITATKLGSTAPTLATFLGNTQQYTFDATNDYVIGTTEVTHEYKEGTDLHAHIHWATNGGEAVDTVVKWQLEYALANMVMTGVGGAFTTGSTLSQQTTIPANTPDRTHMYTDLGDVPGTGIKIGNYLCWKFSRVVGIGTGPANDPFALGVGFHSESDSIGSSTETDK